MGLSDTGAGGSESVDRDGLRNALKRNDKLAAELKAARSNLRLQKQETERAQKYLKQVMAEKQKLAARGGGGAELEEARARIAELERDLEETENDLTILEDRVAVDQAAHDRDRAALEELRRELAARDARLEEVERGAGVDRQRIAAQLEQVFAAEVASLNVRITELEAEEARMLGHQVELEEQVARYEQRIAELEAGNGGLPVLPVLARPPELEAALARIAELESAPRPSGDVTWQDLGSADARADRLAELERELFQREARIASLESQVERFDDLEIELAQREIRIARLEAVLAGREVDPELERARARIAELEALQTELDPQLAQRDQRIARLEAVLAGRQPPGGEVAELEAALKERDARIAQLEAGTRVAELQALLETKQKRISKLEAALMKRGGTLAGLDQTLQLETRLAELEKELASRPSPSEELTRRVAELEGLLAVQAEVQNTLLQEAVKREARISELENETSRNANRRDQLEGHTMAVSQLETELRQERARLARLQKDGQLWLQSEKAAREAEIEQLKRNLSQKAHQEKEQADRLASLQAQVADLEKRGAPGQDSAELEQALARLAAVRAESQAALDREVARNDATVAELDKRLRDVSTQLKAAESEKLAATERVALREARVAELEHAQKMSAMRIGELEQNIKRRDLLLIELEQADRLTQSRAAELETALAQRDIKIAGLEDQLRRVQKELEQVDTLAESFEAEMRAQVEELQRRLAERSSPAGLESGASVWPDSF